MSQLSSTQLPPWQKKQDQVGISKRLLTKRKTASTTRHSIFYSEDEIKSSISSSKKELLHITESLLSGKSTFSYNGKVCNALPLDFHRALLEWNKNSNLEFAIKSIILSAFFSGEAKVGGSALIACAMWMQQFSKIESKRKVRSDEIDEMLTIFGRGGLSCNIASKIFKLGACGCEVKLEEGDQQSTKIEVIEGKEIFGHIDTLFLSLQPGAKISGESFLVAIDGTIESVSQIHRILEEIGDCQLVIAARKFFPDVSNTLADNFSKGRLRVIPFEVVDWGNENFLDLERSGISCASPEIGSEICSMKIGKKISVQAEATNLIYFSENEVSKRKIRVKFGKDIGSLVGISLDRTKTLLALMRFASRGGLTTCKIFGRTMVVPNYSVDYAGRLLSSLTANLQSMGGVISINSQEFNNVF